MKNLSGILSGDIVPAERDAFWLSIALVLAVAAVSLVSRPLMPIDETRYVSVAWEMGLRGDFLVPFKNGAPYSHKPPLLMWLFQAGWALFGVNAWWPRWVSPLASIGSLLLLSRLARRLWPERPAVAATAMLMLVSGLLWLAFSTAAMFDVLLAFFVLCGMHGVLDLADGKTKKGGFLLGLSIGLGVLTKGPVILLHVLPVALLAPVWHPGLRWPRWYGTLVAAVLLGAAIALAWAIPAGMAGGEAFRKAIFWGQTANRVVESFAHRRSVVWYLPLLPVMLFPWFVWPGLWRALKRYVGKGVDRGGRFCLAWMLPVFVAFSLISGKQMHYLIPLFPAFSLLAARALSDVEVAKGAWLPASIVLAAGALLSFLAVTGRPIGTYGVPVLWPALVLVALALFAVIVGRNSPRPIVLLAATGAALMAFGQLSVMPAIAPAYDVSVIANAIREIQSRGGQVAHQGIYDDQYHFAGRLREPLVEIESTAELVQWLGEHPDGYAVIYGKKRDEFKGFPAIALQPYRNGVAAVLDAPTALDYLTFAAADAGARRQGKKKDGRGTEVSGSVPGPSRSGENGSVVSP